jgi:DNA repair protein RecO (recombination protein O)
MAPARLSRQRLGCAALLLRRVPYGEADLVVTLFTEPLGRVAAVARSARRSSRRFPALEPMHLLRVGLELVPGRELGMLTEASLERPRLGLTAWRLRDKRSGGCARRRPHERPSLACGSR